MHDTYLQTNTFYYVKKDFIEIHFSTFDMHAAPPSTMFRHKFPAIKHTHRLQKQFHAY